MNQLSSQLEADAIQVVVVTTNLTIEERDGEKVLAAHLDELGLTAYGLTDREARQSVTKLFNAWVNFYRNEGILEKRLDEFGVQWERLEKYNGSLPIEHTNSEEPSPAEGVSPYVVAHDEPIAMAA